MTKTHTYCQNGLPIPSAQGDGSFRYCQSTILVFQEKIAGICKYASFLAVFQEIEEMDITEEMNSSALTKLANTFSNYLRFFLPSIASPLGHVAQLYFDKPISAVSSNMSACFAILFARFDMLRVIRPHKQMLQHHLKS